jgi:hypothetical protein
MWIVTNPGPAMVGEVAAGEEAIRYGYGAYGVIGERCPFCEQREVLSLDVVVLVDRADDVTDDCSEHVEFLALTSSGP